MVQAKLVSSVHIGRVKDRRVLWDPLNTASTDSHFSSLASACSSKCEGSNAPTQDSCSHRSLAPRSTCVGMDSLALHVRSSKFEALWPTASSAHCTTASTLRCRWLLPTRGSASSSNSATRDCRSAITYAATRSGGEVRTEDQIPEPK